MRERRLEDDLAPDAKPGGQADDLGHLARGLAQTGGERREAMAEQVEDRLERVCRSREQRFESVTQGRGACRAKRTGDGPLLEVVEHRPGQAKLAAHMRERGLAANLAQYVAHVGSARRGDALE